MAETINICVVLCFFSIFRSVAGGDRELFVSNFDQFSMTEVQKVKGIVKKNVLTIVEVSTNIVNRQVKRQICYIL